MMLNMVFNVGETLMLTSEKTKNLSFLDKKVIEIADERLPKMYAELKEGKEPVTLGTAISLVGQAIREIVVLIFTNSKESEERLVELRSSFTKTMFVLANRNLLIHPEDKEAQSFAELTYISLFNNVLANTAPTTGTGDEMTQADVEGFLKGKLNELQERDQAAAERVPIINSLLNVQTAPMALFTIE